MHVVSKASVSPIEQNPVAYSHVKRSDIEHTAPSSGLFAGQDDGHDIVASSHETVMVDSSQ